jgi:Restriction endonuclease
MGKKARPGREFEELVARFEEVLAPLGATVKSPDYIKDQVTGQQREVDASIRDTERNSDHLITLECRDHKRGQDVRWIEQLATKRRDIGASKTVAVSRRGFSSAAKAKARHYEIVLRRISEITDADIIRVWGGLGITIVFPEFALIGLELTDEGGCPIQLEDFPEAISEAFRADPTSTGLLKRKGRERLISAADVFNVRVQDGIWLCRDGEFPLIVVMKSSGDQLSVTTTAGNRVVSRAALKFLVQRREVDSSIESVRRYGSMEETLLDQINAVADLGNAVVQTEFLGRVFKSLPGPD